MENQVVISATGLFAPEQIISNEELVESFNAFTEAYNQEHSNDIAAGKLQALQPSSAEFILKASGIERRHVLNRSGILDPKRLKPQLEKRSNDEPSLLAEIGSKAAVEALERASVKASDIDMVIVACSNLQRAYPAISIEIQNILQIPGYAFDMNVACSSATFGINQAYNSIRCGSIRRALVINPEVCSAHLNFKDRDSHFIFGDVSTAIVIEDESICQSKESFKILGSRLRTSFSNNIRNNFGFLNRCEDQHEETSKNDRLFVQNGRKVFKEVVPFVGSLLLEHMEELQINVESIRRLWLHQANLNMNKLICKKVLGQEASFDKAPVVLNEFANTSSAGSIIALHQHQSDLKDGDLGFLCSFGAGYSVGSIALQKRVLP